MWQDERTLGFYLKQALSEIGNGNYSNEVALRREYDKLVGETVSRFTQSFTLYKGTLRLRVATPALKYELLMRRTGLRKALNAGVGSEVVKRIVVL